MTLTKSKTRAILILIAVLGFSAKANATNLVVNGDFSSMYGWQSGWTLTGDTSYSGLAPGGLLGLRWVATKRARNAG